MDGYIRVLQKNSSVVHQLWQIWFPGKLLIEFENGKCRIIPVRKLDGQLKGFRYDSKKLVYAPEESLELLIETATDGNKSADAQKIVDNLYLQFGQLLMIYEQRNHSELFFSSL
jgi:hypothetical protein